ncbi:MAG: DUF6144 family protein [Candidatus Thorarchaeota archaeon]
MIDLMDGFDKYLEQEKKIILLEDCGRKCLHDRREELVQKAKNLYRNSNDIIDFLEKLSKIYTSLYITNDEIAFIWDKCYCPIIGDIPPGQISPTYCNCSRGWVKELIESASGKSIDVIIDEAVTKGDSRCKLRVII